MKHNPAITRPARRKRGIDHRRGRLATQANELLHLRKRTHWLIKSLGKSTH